MLVKELLKSSYMTLTHHMQTTSTLCSVPALSQELPLATAATTYHDSSKQVP